MPGHMLFIPRRHVEKISELNKEEQEELIEVTIEFQEKSLTFNPKFRKTTHLNKKTSYKSLTKEVFQWQFLACLNAAAKERDSAEQSCNVQLSEQQKTRVFLLQEEESLH